VVEIGPEEARALADALRGPAPASAAVEVEVRDFHRPRRLSRGDLELLRRPLLETLPELASSLKPLLRRDHPFELEELGEASCEGLFDSLSEPLALLRFDAAGQPGWLVWDALPALAALEIALGQSEAKQDRPRAFTPVEKLVLERLMSAAASITARALEVTLVEPRIVSTLELAGSWRDGGPKADPQRLYVQLGFDGPGSRSRMRLYLPSPAPAAAPPKQAPAPAKVALPQHLGEVGVPLAARLGRIELRLGELLSIEVGDVIPLGIPAGSPVTLVAGDKPCLAAELGASRGRLAARIQGPCAPKSNGPPADEKRP
jgi:flagellar motor switch protein FliM